MKTIITIALTSIFWLLVFYFINGTSTENVAQEECVDIVEVSAVESVESIEPATPEVIKPVPTNEYAQALIGKWKEVDGCVKLEFTKYGELKGVYSEKVYKLRGNIVNYGYNSNWMNDNFKIGITHSSENYYLEIYNNTDYAGRYKREK